MNKKRLLALILALCMVFALFACGTEEEYDDSADDDDDDEETSQTDDGTEGTDPTDPEGTDPTDPDGDNNNPTIPGGNGNQGNTQQPQPQPNPNYPGSDDNQGTQQPDDPKEPEDNTGNDNTGNDNTGNDDTNTENPTPPAVDTILGSWNGNTYYNDYADFQVTFPSNWSYHPVSSSIDPANPFANNAVQFTDMNASCSTGSSISVIYQNPTAYNGGISANNTEEENIDLILAEEDALRQAYQAQGMTVTFLGKDYITFAGQSHCVLKTVVTYYNIEVHMYQIYTYGNSDTPVMITLSGIGATEMQNVLNMFSAY